MRREDFLNSTHFSNFSTHSSFLNRIKSGDETAWFKFHERYVRMIRHIGTLRGLTPAECDDLMIDVMVIFWKKAESFVYDPEHGRFRSYLGAIANFAALKLLGKNRPQTGPLPEDYPAEVDVTEMEKWHDYLLGKAVEELRESVDTVTYEAFYMLCIQERSVSDVAAVTRKSPNTLYGIRHRCLQKLKKIIAEYRRFEDAALSSAIHTETDDRPSCRKTPPPSK